MILGVDYGVRRLAVADAHGFVAVHRLRPPADVPAELRRLAGWLAGLVPPQAELWLEEPLVGTNRNIRTGMRLAMTVGCLCTVHAGPVHLVSTTAWKRGVVGRGNADKATVAGWLGEHHPALAAACGGDQDLVDATCLALHGLSATGGLAGPGGLPGAPGPGVLRASRGSPDEPARGIRRS